MHLHHDSGSLCISMKESKGFPQLFLIPFFTPVQQQPKPCLWSRTFLVCQISTCVFKRGSKQRSMWPKRQQWFQQMHPSLDGKGSDALDRISPFTEGCISPRIHIRSPCAWFWAHCKQWKFCHEARHFFMQWNEAIVLSQSVYCLVSEKLELCPVKAKRFLIPPGIRQRFPHIESIHLKSP